MTEGHLKMIADVWTVPCGPHDFGVDTTGCACPQGDPRPVISGLLREIERLRRPQPPGAGVVDVARTLLGRRVVVTVNKERLEAGGGESSALPIEYVGVLHAVTEDGEVALVDDDGVRAYCWPLLEIRPAVTP
jgi:hypothetical protein